MRIKVVYEDKSLIVIHKPAGLATQSSKVGQADVVSELKNYFASKKEQVYVGVIHRLDQPVEGILIFAKDKKTAASLSSQLAEGTLNKEYLAAVYCLKESEPSGDLIDYLIKDGNNMAQVVGEHTPGAKRAILHYETLHTVDDSEDKVKIMKVHIDTGRFHQIRVQMAHGTMPLLGDIKYGGEVPLEINRKYGIGNVALFANKICFIHPATGRLLSFEIKSDNKIFQ